MKLVLVCYSGSSASILRDRMLAWARANLLDVEIIVSSLAGLDEDKEDADIVLVATAGALCTGKRKRAGTGEDSGHGSGYQRLWYGKGRPCHAGSAG